MPQTAVETIRSVIKDLAKTELLNKCEGYTQNANESLNTAKWTYPPKAHKRLKTVNTTAALAVLSFNDGASSLWENIKEMDICRADACGHSVKTRTFR